MQRKPSVGKYGDAVAAVFGAAVALVILFFLPFLFTYTIAGAVAVAGAAAGAAIRHLFTGLVIPLRKRRSTAEAIGARLNTQLDFDVQHSLPSESMAELLRESLSCSVFAPPVAAPGDDILIQAFAHLKGSEKTALLLAARGVDPTATLRITKDLKVSIPLSSRLGFHLCMKGVEIDDPDQEIVWGGAPDAVQFNVTIPEDFRPRSVAGKLHVTKGGIPIGHMSFILRVVSTEEKRNFDKAPLEMAGTLSRYNQAFISYASEDREKVLPRVQALEAAKIKIFQDFIHLKPGERWEQEIYKHIGDCDVFFLFWSQAAKDSKWVCEEAKYAREKQAGKDDSPPEIIPIIIEGPPPVPPPPELDFLQFNDKYIYLMKGVEAERGH